MWFLLQDMATDSVSTSGAGGSSRTLWDIIVGGGIPMAILALLLVAAIYLFIERYLTINKSDADSADFMGQVRTYVMAGNLEAAKGLCDSRNDPFARMIKKGIERLGNASLEDIRTSIENVGELEVYRMERRLSLLATIAGAAPMIGFFGTVLGMIAAFNQILDQGGQTDATSLAGGIGQALVTTAGGLAVGILAYLFYNSLVAMKDKVIYKLELTSTSFIDLLQEPAG